MTKPSKKSALSVAIAGMFLSPFSQSAEIEWGGFLSVVGGQTLGSDEVYDAAAFAQGNAVYENKISFGPDSVIGLQGQTQVTDKLRATIQIIGRAGESMDSVVEWAYLTYDVSDNFQVNAGKFRLPMYYYSDFLDVGYAYYWVRPPIELYRAPSSVVGVNTRYTGIQGDLEYSMQAWYGSNTYDAKGFFGPTVPDIEVNDNWGINFVTTYDWMSFRFVYHETDMEAEEINMDQIVRQVGFAYMIDYNNFMLRSEYTRLELGADGLGFLPSWYVSTGYNFDGITPHITYVENERDDQEVFTYGVSYDVFTNAKLKFEYSDLKDTSENNNDSRLVTVGIDMVF